MRGDRKDQQEFLSVLEFLYRRLPASGYPERFDLAIRCAGLGNVYGGNRRLQGRYFDFVRGS